MPQFLRTTLAFLMRHKIKTALVLGVIAGALVGISVFGKDAAPNLPEESFPMVEVKTVSELASGGALLPLVGSVESESEATIQTERGGQIMSVNYALGDRVSAGAVIATLENRSEAAAVAQAQAGVEAGQANLAQLEGQISRATRTTASDALAGWRSAFITADNAVNNQTEPFFENDRGQFPNLIISTSNDERIEAGRARVGDLVRTWERELDEVSANDPLLTHLQSARERLNEIQTFLNDLSSVVNRQMEPGEDGREATEGDRAGLAAARASIATVLSNLIATEDAVRQELSQGGNGVESNENEAGLAASRAALNQARASLRSAQANFEKTIVRAPIAGSISFIALDRGNYVGMSAPVVTITNPGALEVVTFITETDAEIVTPGSEVMIDGTHQGRVTRVAPALNPQTKKIEVRIGFVDSDVPFTPGATVSVSLTTSTAPAKAESTALSLSIPLTALKLTPQGATVFTVEDSALVPHNITVDRILGESVLVTEGLTSDMRIVVDARGRKAGEKVSVTVPAK